MSSCIFCKIAHSEIPAHILYEDADVIAFLDHRPVREGHAMIIPKIHTDHFIDLAPAMTQHIMAVAQKLAIKIKDTLNPPRIGFLVSGFGVNHAHFHVQPLWEEHDITSARYLNISHEPPSFDPLLVDIADHAQQAELCKKLELT